MKMRIFALLFFGVVLLVFQLGNNEFTEPNPEVYGDLTQNGIQEVIFRVSELTPAKATYLYLLNARNTTVMDSKNLREKSPYYYRIDLKNSAMQSLDYLEKKIEGVQHCLTEKLKSELNQILANAQICDSPNIEAPAKNITCKTNYTLPYAILSFENSKNFNLGEKNTTCDYPTGLCGELNQKLIDWVRQVMIGIKELTCSPI